MVIFTFVLRTLIYTSQEENDNLLDENRRSGNTGNLSQNAASKQFNQKQRSGEGILQRTYDERLRGKHLPFPFKEGVLSDNQRLKGYQKLKRIYLHQENRLRLPSRESSNELHVRNWHHVPVDKDYDKCNLAALFRPRAGMGNLMFQYASLLGIANANNMNAVVSDDNRLLNYFNLSASRTSLSPTQLAQMYNIFTVPGVSKFHTTAHQIPPENTILKGYLQSYKYFQNYAAQIRKEFTFGFDTQQKAKRLWDEKVSPLIVSKATFVGVHVRRGNIVDADKLMQGYVAANKEYILRAMALFESRFPDAVFIVCSNEIEWCEMNLDASNVIFMDADEEPEVDMSILRNCDHVIITTGSFGWWSGFLAGGDVVYFADGARPGSSIAENFYPNDYYPSHWQTV